LKSFQSRYSDTVAVILATTNNQLPEKSEYYHLNSLDLDI